MRFEPFNRDLKMSLWFLEILVILSGFVLVALGNRLVKLVVRAFYDLTIPAKRDDQAITAKSDNKGIAVVALDALTRRQWF
ncbi:general transcription factor IIE subunit 1 [Melia azedarach]|uniref:General transcription factor IIE subunit 1 n=1 Tax=Melia azedarach TaxID=155640 RepID=A0ACC1X2T4_MELAZ|nr:general transcription factor IIE subunit 1 [Melia azedarach]